MDKISRKEEAQLIVEAKKAAKSAHSPYSGVKVGAAILTPGGKVFSGCNVENSSYGLSICAERTAAVKAVSAGFRKFSAVAVVSNLEGFTYPCGACRQFLSEFGTNMIVIVAAKNGEILRRRLSELLPEAFKLEE